MAMESGLRATRGILLCRIAISLAPFCCGGQVRSNEAPRDAAEKLKSSRNPRELARAAQVLAASSSAGDHRLLLAFLKAAEFRRRLDADDADTGPDDLW